MGHLLTSWILICSFHMTLHCLATYSDSVYLKEVVDLHFLSIKAQHFLSCKAVY